MVSSICSDASSSMLGSIYSSGTTPQTGSIGEGFSISEFSSADEVQGSQEANGGNSGGSDSSSKDDPMDLNGDGKVTMNEVMQYLAMQMADNLGQENGSEAEGSQNQSQSKNGISAFIGKLAQAAYSQFA